MKAGIGLRAGVGVGFAFALLDVLPTPAMAYKWPGTDASIGSAISAKVIGQKCPGILSASEMSEIEAFLAKAASEWTADPAHPKAWFETFVSGLTADYETKYPQGCGDASEEAKDTLQRVRKVMASGKTVLPDTSDPNRRPDAGEVIRAKIVAEKCDTALTAREWADLELYLAQYFVAVAKSAIDADARATLALYKSSERTIADAWAAKDCTDATTDAKAVAARVRKALDASAR